MDPHFSLNIIGPRRFRSPSRRETDHHTGAGKRWRLAAFLLFGPCRCESTGVAHVVPGGLDPIVEALDVRDAELIDMTVEGISGFRYVPSAAEGS